MINPAFVCSSEKMSSEKKVFAVATLLRRVQFDKIELMFGVAMKLSSDDRPNDTS